MRGGCGVRCGFTCKPKVQMRHRPAAGAYATSSSTSSTCSSTCSSTSSSTCSSTSSSMSSSSPTMFLWRLLSVGLLCALTACRAQSDCTDLPEFSPSLLVVRFGDPALAICSVCNGSCEHDLRMEEPLSASFRRGGQVIWNVTRLEEWNIRPICFIFDSDCREYLNVIVYQPPETVSLSWEGPSGPLVEGGLFSLLCEVGAVAPAQKMTVAFYRGHRELGAQSSRTPQKTPVNESFSLNYTVSREDHGAHFWCEARLELGPEGPQPPPVVRSQNVSANVLYAPYSGVSAEPQLLTVVQGQSAELDCSSEGNPGPHYSWSVPSDSHTLFSDSVFTIHSASSQHEGLYTCNASNSVGSLRRSFTLTVRDVPVRTSAAPVVTVTPANRSAAPVVTVTPANKSAGNRSALRLSVCISLWLSLSCHLCCLHVLW